MQESRRMLANRLLSKLDFNVDHDTVRRLSCTVHVCLCSAAWLFCSFASSQLVARCDLSDPGVTLLIEVASCLVAGTDVQVHCPSV